MELWKLGSAKKIVQIKKLTISSVSWILLFRTFFAIFDLIGVGDGFRIRYILVTESLSPVLSPTNSFLNLSVYHKIDVNIKTIWSKSKIDVTNISVGHSDWLSPQKFSELLLLIWYWWLVGDKIKILLTSSWCWHPILISIDRRCRWL